MTGHLHAFWNDLWPNVVAPSLWTLLAVVISHLRSSRRHAEIAAAAAAAHRIAADLFERGTGEAHPHAPEKRDG